MKVHDDHLYHGAALIQIAEHPQFTAINSFNLKGQPNANAYKINDHIGVYLKYSAKPTKNKFKEYTFTFIKSHLATLAEMKTHVNKVILALVCVKDKEICYLTYEELMALVEERKKQKGGDEDQYTIKVTVPKGKSLRAYMDVPERRKMKLGEIIVPRNSFPNQLFE